MMTEEWHWLLAPTQNHGIGEAQAAGWTYGGHIGPYPRMQGPSGETVAVTSSADNLVDLPPHTTIYLAGSWLFAHGDPRGVLQAHRANGGKVLNLDGSEADWL